MARRARAPLNVLLNGRLVGTLRREATGAVEFQYARDWFEWDRCFPISLSLPLREDRYVGDPVINVFDNLLPDGDILRRRIAERVDADGIDAFSLLTRLGHDCVGALQFVIDGSDPGAAGSILGKPVDDGAIAAILDNLGAAPLGVGDDADFRISIAGAQEKTALLRHQGRWLKPTGMTATTHILKPRIGRLPNGIDLSNSVENEYLCLALLTAFGVPTAKVEIAAFEGRTCLIVERFDRLWTQDGRLLRLPQEDCCQALSVPSTRKYQSDGGPGIHEILGLLKGSDEPEKDIATFLRATIVFWLLGATDGHAKNFSVFLTPAGRYHMTPLYDVLTAQPSLDANQIRRRQFRLAMSVGKGRHYAMHDITPRYFMETADLAGIGRSVVTSIVDDLAQSAIMRAETIFDALPPNFPEPLVASVRSAIADHAPPRHLRDKRRRLAGLERIPE